MLDVPVVAGEENVVVALAGADHLEGERRDVGEVEGPASRGGPVGGRRRGVEGVTEVDGDVARLGGEGHHGEVVGLVGTGEP